ncbi:hypothetical protein [Streptomyces sp. NPDC091299]|uniref:hypothetical protein n=1 Tax=Streptomyces sp. NPDC091299 TaxID=3155302 RepID=UPI003448C9F0
MTRPPYEDRTTTNPCDPPAGLPGIPVGALVRDRVTGREGTLWDVLLHRSADELPGPEGRPAGRLAFFRPVGGGQEWTTEPDQVVPVSEPQPSCSRTVDQGRPLRVCYHSSR